jgi:kelch-like protein 2/3
LIEALKFHLLKTTDASSSCNSNGGLGSNSQEGAESTVFTSPRIKPRQPMGLPQVGWWPAIHNHHWTNTQLMLVIGGQAPKAIRNVDMYDFQSETWSSLTELPQRRCRCGVCL